MNYDELKDIGGKTVELFQKKPSELKKVMLSERAVEARINRKLAQDNKKLCKSRQNTMAYNNMGRYYIVDTYNNTLIRSEVNLKNLALELGVMAQWETLPEAVTANDV